MTINQEGEQVGHNTYTFDSKDENIIKTVITGGGFLQSALEYGDYDDKHFRLTNYPWKWKTSSISNARAQKLTAMGVEVGAISLDQIWKYTYNDSGYPVKAEIYNRGSDVLAETREYIYKKAN
ncbi:hypothetical protein [Niabella hirudinis]|uniref:hypothetical protein n=1 Tax=Niabella hirudinis TaxID=1285929 RepID=UPI003EC0C5A8